MLVLRPCAALLWLAVAVSAQTEVGVGQGAPTDLISQRFSAALGRNQFRLLVSLPPQGEVQKYGATGAIQYLSDAAKTSGVRYALLKGDVSKPPRYDGSLEEWVDDVYQLRATMWAYYSSVGSATAGYPVMDTQSCPIATDNPCTYQLFDKNYGLFVFEKNLGLLVGTNLSLRDPFYTRWMSAGGIRSLGPPLTAETALTSILSAATATAVSFQQGILLNTTSGLQNGRLFLVGQPFFDVYTAAGGPADRLGFPIGDAQTLADGTRRQAFEGGILQAALDGAVGVKSAVQFVTIYNSGAPWRLKLGDSIQVRASVTLTSGEEASDRAVAWTTSNGRVATVAGSGLTATVRGVGAGTAMITAVSEGKTSPPFQVLVSAPCCAAGEGAPTLAIRQAFEDALRRNRLSIRFPAPPLRRAGAGYVQEFLTDADPAARVVVAVGDSRLVGYPVQGEILARYESLGSVGGSLGYPASDPTAAGRQDFENHAALAGSPVRLVSGAIYDRWSILAKESGAAGPPASEAAGFLTYMGTVGSGQLFQKGTLYVAQSGSLIGRSFFVSGAILKTYLANSGPAGRIGMPLADEVLIDGRHRQEFEGATLEAGLTDLDAVIKEKARRPNVSATPAVVTAGGQVRIALGAFPEGAVLRVSVGTQPEFRVAVPSGAYAWLAAIPRDARSATVRVRAVSDDGAAQAEATYQVRSLAETRFTLSKIQGDVQTAAPGSLAPLRLRVAVSDPSGNPAPGVPVVWQASPGALVVRASALSDANGYAEAGLRMPAAEGVALATASTSGQVVTFSARAVSSKLSNFTGFNIAGLSAPLGNGSAPISERGALLAAAASMVRFYQDRGALAVPNGPADPIALNQFLKLFCLDGPQGNPICDGFIVPESSSEQLVNLWRVPAFVGGGASWLVGTPTAADIRDAVAQGAPVLVALDLTVDGLPAGAHFVVAKGIDAAGRVLVHDPNPFFGANALDDLLTEFSAGGRRWTGAIAAVLQLSPQPGSGNAFLIVGPQEFDLLSAGPVCGTTLDWLDRAASAVVAPGLARPFRMRHCDDSTNMHELRVAGDGPHRLFLTDMGALATTTALSGVGAAAYRIERLTGWTAAPEHLTLDPAGPVLNSASLAPDIAPGTLIAVFGAGLSGPGQTTTVEVDGRAATVTSQGPFRIDAALPADLPVGRATLRITSAYGSIEQVVDLQLVAPAIFVSTEGQAAVLNATGLPNRADQPARRGSVVSIFSTGLGVLRPENSPARTQNPVSVLLDGRELTPAYSGAAPNLPGVYQVNVQIPIDTAPGVGRLLVLKQAGILSRAVELAVE
jgi:uncharacterized protein (TIGR03437 family)